MAIFKGIKKPTHPKKTYEEVFADLVKISCEKANNSLSNPISLPAQPFLTDLQTVYKQISYDHFKATFQYQFNDQPPSLAPGTSVLSHFEQFYKVEDQNKNTIHSGTSASGTHGLGTTQPFEPIPDDRQPLQEILDDFRNQIVGLPVWMQDDARNQIIGRLQTVFGETGIPNEWTEDINNPVYEQSLHKYANSVRLDCVFIRLSGLLVEAEVEAKLDTVYCIGTYYQVVSAATIANKALWKSLYSEAALLQHPPPPTPDDPSLKALEGLLVSYRDTKLFETDHEFAFNGTPDNMVQDLGRPTHLFVIKDDNFFSLYQDINREIFSKITFPQWIPATAKDDLQEEIEGLLRSSATNSNGWLSVNYDKTLPPPSKDDPIFLIKANLVYCNLTAPGRHDVTYRALYFCGVFYTAKSTSSTVGQDVLTAVYKNAIRLLSNGLGNYPAEPSFDDLNTLIYRILAEKFLAAFTFAYDGDQTAPSDKVGDVLYTAKVGFNSETRDDAAAAAAAQMFIDALKFPWGTTEAALRQSIYDDLVAKTKRCINADAISNPFNHWGVMTHNREYTYADSSQNTLLGRAVILYCNGSVTAGDTTEKNSFIYFMGTFYEAESSGGW